MMLIPSSLTQENEFPLWPEGAPGARGCAPEDIPTLTAYLPDPAKATGASVVICPGGGYEGLAPHEGATYAQWLNQSGVTALVLKYRLGSNGYRHPAMWQDASRALRIVRANAAKWHLDPARIGIMGSSAGGHLAATLITHYDAGQPDAADPIERVSCRPDLGILCYAVITMTEGTHGGTREHLLGTSPAPELINDLSGEKQVTADTPTCFIWHTWEDGAVPVENSINFASALREKGIKFDLHVYQKGDHGIGLGGDLNAATPLHPWTNDCLYWLRAQRFVK